MSCSSYGQGLQSCLEPTRLVEPPRILRLKLAPPKSNISSISPPARKSIPPDSDCNSKTTANDKIDMGGWSFLQCLATNKSENNKEDCDKDKVYIPPNFKRSASMLSEKSLEMCTESLGSETGSDEMALTCYPNGDDDDEILDKKTKLKETRRMTRSASFPPPLTSISGSTAVQMRPHREGGRLVLKAVSFSCSQTYFQAERIDGRLRLHLMKDCDDITSDEEEEQVEEDEEEEVEIEDEEEEREIENWEEGFEENNGNGGGEMGMEKLARPRSRCMEVGMEPKACLIGKVF